MGKQKWHRNCGGIVVYQENPDPNGSFKKAGYCFSCGKYPINDKDIIIKFNDELFERFVDVETKGRRVELIMGVNTLFDGIKDVEEIRKMKAKNTFLLFRENELPETLEKYTSRKNRRS